MTNGTPDPGKTKDGNKHIKLRFYFLVFNLIYLQCSFYSVDIESKVP